MNYDPTDVQNKLSDALDESLLDIIQNGRMMIDFKTGEVVTDDEGEPVRMQATAADHTAAVNRLKSLGITKVPAPGDPTDLLRRELCHEDDGSVVPFVMPPVSEEEDAATAS